MSAKSENKANHTNYDVIVIGGGLAGLTLTACLGAENIRVLCIDRMTRAQKLTPAVDTRTTAISYGSSQILQRAGIWEALQGRGCPIEDIHILDGQSPVLLDFKAHEVQAESFGWIFENLDLQKALFERIDSLPETQFETGSLREVQAGEEFATVTLEDGRTYSSQLVVGADGRGSLVRTLAGIPVRQWPYGQTALVCMVTHENPHQNIAVEHFRSDGPFAVLPFTDTQDGQHRSAVVWSEHGQQNSALMKLEDEAFNLALQARFPDWYGRVKVLGGRQSYPLGLIHARDYVAPRVALIADAAHGIHPIAGQGLNLGLRDVEALSNLLTEAKAGHTDLGHIGLLNRYNRLRRLDNTAMAGATDLLNRLFATDLPPVRAVRQMGLKMISKFAPAKTFFMRQAMGLSVMKMLLLCVFAWSDPALAQVNTAEMPERVQFVWALPDCGTPETIIQYGKMALAAQSKGQDLHISPIRYVKELGNSIVTVAGRDRLILQTSEDGILYELFVKDGSDAGVLAAKDTWIDLPYTLSYTRCADLPDGFRPVPDDILKAEREQDLKRLVKDSEDITYFE